MSRWGFMGKYIMAIFLNMELPQKYKFLQVASDSWLLSQALEQNIFTS